MHNPIAGGVEMEQATLRYEQVARQIEAQIEDGVWVTGERLPSVRRLSKQAQVSATTVVEAYRLLESRGVVEARPQSGHFVRAPHLRRARPEPQLAAPALPALELVSRPVQSSGLIARMFAARGRADLVDFGAAVPHPSFLPGAELARAMARAVRRAPQEASQYSFAPGYEPLRRMIAQRGADVGLALRPDEVIITLGGTEALAMAIQATTAPGDVVALESPAYYGFLQLLEALGRRALELPSSGDGVPVEALERALGAGERIAACLLTPTVSNPLGAVMPEAARERLARLLVAHGVALIEDDVYGELLFEQERPRAVSSWMGDLGLVCGSFSKTLAPGYRVGWLVPGRYMERALAMQRVVSLAAPTPTQMAIASYLREGAYDRHLRQMRRRYERAVAEIAAVCAARLPSQTRMTRPAGGHLLWCELPPGVDTAALMERALERGVGFAPGAIFSSQEGAYTRCLRINAALPLEPRVEEALGVLGELARG
jgi:DNA-binding transcriptional MocR family regulator